MADVCRRRQRLGERRGQWRLESDRAAPPAALSARDGPRTHTPNLLPRPNPRNTKNQVWDNERVVIIPDHYIFTSDARANRNVDILRDMAQKYAIKYFYDITDRCASK